MFVGVKDFNFVEDKIANIWRIANMVKKYHLSGQKSNVSLQRVVRVHTREHVGVWDSPLRMLFYFVEKEDLPKVWVCKRFNLFTYGAWRTTHSI